jgi:hypothetical protein
MIHTFLVVVDDMIDKLAKSKKIKWHNFIREQSLQAAAAKSKA